MSLKKIHDGISPFFIYTTQNSHRLVQNRPIHSYYRGAFSFSHTRVLKLLVDQVVRLTKKKEKKTFTPKWLAEPLFKLFNKLKLYYRGPIEKNEEFVCEE